MKSYLKVDKYIIILTAIVITMCYLIFYRLPLNGFYFISNVGDIKEQYIHFFHLFHSLIRSGEWPFWTWEFGPGGSFWNQFGYYMLGDIFIWPMLLLPKALFPYSFIPLSSFKILLMALGMYLFLKKLGIKRVIALLAGISYSFAILYFENSSTHYFFVNPAVFFPFLLWSYEKYLSEKRILWFTVVFFFCAISNFYFLFMLTVGLIIYVLFRFLTQDYVDRSIKGFWSFHWRLAVLYLLSLGIAMVFFLPSVIGFLQSNAFFRPEKPPFDEILTPGELIRKLLWSGGIHFVPLITIPLLLMNGKRNFVYGLMALSLFLMILFQNVNSMIGGFSLPKEFRAFFIYNALFITLSAIALNNINFSKIKNIAGLIIFSGVIYYWLFRNPFTHYGQYLLYLPFLFTVSYLLYSNVKKSLARTFYFSLSLLAVCLYSLAISYSFISDTIVKSNGGDPSNYHKGVWGTFPLMNRSDYNTSYENELVKNGLDNIKDDKEFYRIYLNARGVTTHNSSMTYGYRSFYAYNSLLQWNLQRFEMDDLGQLGSRSLSMLRGYPNSTILNTLLGNKYNVAFSGKGSNLYGYETIKKQGDLIIERNNHWLPIGFLYDHSMSVSDFEKMGMENQEEMMLKNAIIPDKLKKQFQLQSDSSLTSNSLADLSNAKFENAEKVEETDEGIFVESTKPIIITLPVKRHALGELFVFSDIIPDTPNDGLKIDLTTDRGVYYYLEKNAVGGMFITTQYHYTNTTNKVLFRFGMDDQTKWVRQILQPGKYLIKNMNVSLGNYKTYEQWTNKFKENSLQNIEYSNNSISGRIEANKGSILFLSIPFAKGWTATIDNKKTEVFPVHIAYSGIYVPEGSHDIKLSYTPEGLKLGLIISLLSILILLGLRQKKAFHFKSNI